jgi:hypothetical protein
LRRPPTYSPSRVSNGFEPCYTWLMPVFEPRFRDDPEPLRSGESTFSLLDRVDDAAIDRVRRLVNSWFDRFPSDSRDELRGRLTSGNDVDFNGAFWELYLHEAYSRLGYSVDTHPPLPDAPTHPDFLIEGNGVSLYLEATVVGEARSEVAESKRIARIEESLNRIHSPDFSIFLGVDNYGRASPSMRNVRPRIEAWLETLDWNDVRQKLEADPFFELPSLEYEQGDWEFIFRAYPKPQDQRGRADIRTVGAGPMRSGYLDDASAIRAGIGRKVGRYGRPDRPLVVAIAVDRAFADAEDVNYALFGTPAVRVVSDDRVESVRLPNGVWIGESGVRNTRLSALLVGYRIYPWSVATAQPQVWIRPNYPRPGDTLGAWTRFEVDMAEDKLRRHDGTFDPIKTLDLPGLLDLATPESWPGKPFERS